MYQRRGEIRNASLEIVRIWQTMRGEHPLRIESRGQDLAQVISDITIFDKTSDPADFFR